jgi:hypothetical protein
VGRYAHLGGAMCLITLAVVSVGIIFITIAVRVIQRPDLRIPSVVTILLVIILASFFGFAVGSGEQVFVSDRLNVGEALFLAVAGTLLGSTSNNVEQVSWVTRSDFDRCYSDAFWRPHRVALALGRPEQVHITRRMDWSEAELRDRT